MNLSLIGIVAMAPNRVIGKGTTIPWHYSEDLKFFKKVTTGYPIIMGRSTFESLGNKPLPNRINLIVSSTLDCTGRNDIIVIRNGIQGVKALPYVYQKLPRAYQKIDKMFIIGGAQLYKDTFSIMDGLYITHIKKEYNGDVYMPPFEEYFPNKNLIQTNEDFEIFYYSK